MILFTQPQTPKTMAKGDIFRAKQYPRDLFGDFADPILNVDWFEMSGPTFPAHPHAGFSAVTYLFEDSENGFVNRDSLGNDLILPPGSTHWSRASRGLVHEETPIAGSGTAHGLQIFVNMPEKAQSDPAGAFHVSPDQVDVRQGKRVVSRTPIHGTQVGDTPNALPNPIHIEEVQLGEHASWEVNLPSNWGGIAIVIEGEATIGAGQKLKTTEAIGFRSAAADVLRLSTDVSTARIAVLTGKQLRQPIHAHGPFILASQAALIDRVEAFRRGEFGEVRSNAA